MIKVSINDKIEEFNLEEALPLLSVQRREQCLRFKHELGRKQCAAAYLLLCQGLREEYGITEPPIFEYGEHGKPVIVGHPEICFNISHCREAVMCVLSNKPVGVDIESVHRYSESLARYTMNDEEMKQILQAENPAVQFTKFWTMKEAVLKLSGHGLTDNLKVVLEDFTGKLKTVDYSDKNYVYSIAAYSQPIPEGRGAK